jgi:DNA-binding NtrC family response regulator
MSAQVNEALKTDQDPGFVAGQSSAIGNVNAILGEIASTNISALLIGESGTGKEVYARRIHRLSEHNHSPIQKLNCRALDGGDLPAAMRAALRRESNATRAEVRTVFLDGIDELDLASQRALLSVLPDGEPEEDGDLPMRLIASASQNLKSEVESGRFRGELFFRVCGVCLRLPALRERKEDIRGFLEHFLAKYAAELRREIPRLSDEQFEQVKTHDWPGNIRELENFVRKICLFGDAKEAIQELGRTAQIGPTGLGEPQDSSLKAAARSASRQAERELIRIALERTHWNRKRAAEELQISYKSLLYKIKQTGLEE